VPLSQPPNLLGAYGAWAASLVEDPPRLSFRRSGQGLLDTWRAEARARFRSALLQPELGPAQPAETVRAVERDGLMIEELRWAIGYGPATEAVVIRPASMAGPLPAVLALHDHGGDKLFGTRKVTNAGEAPHPRMRRHHERFYGGVAWADELARRGYVVMAHDVFPFASRRVRAGDLPEAANPDGATDAGDDEAMQAYDRLASVHEHVLAKSLLCAGTSLPGLVTAEDQRALDHLVARPDVDPLRIGCCGLSGGGLRAVQLAALEPRLACIVVAGMMTTWRDFLLHKSLRHTWMIYLAGLPRDLDYPDLLTIAAPTPTLVQSSRDDELFTLAEMQRAHSMIGEVYAKIGAEERQRSSFHAGPHKFDLEMQAEAFSWLDVWLRQVFTGHRGQRL
jgi:dienelactone hydrolase